MSDIAIRAEGLGKLFRIGAPERYRTLRDTVAETLTAPLRWLRGTRATKPEAETFWALKDVGFEIRRGEVIGVIGRNGAGKSTLLKILSRITEPTEGFAEIHGRVGSLLEVGTGFHPELTGRENIFLNGAILGMKKAEILRKFDEIVAFAEVEKFIDTPVKHFSSGMYMRLAFAVAAHLEPEILIVDEVLAVGDAQFQKKCLGKMGDVAREGRTVVFVSHQLNQIRRLCGTGLWLDDGRVRGKGPISSVTGEYEQATAPTRTRSEAPRKAAKAQFTDWQIVDAASDQPAYMITNHGPFKVRFSLTVNQPLRSCLHGISLLALDGQPLWGHGTRDVSLNPGNHEIEYSIASLPLRPGAYQWMVSLYEEGRTVDVWECLPHMVVGTSPANEAGEEWLGLLNFDFDIALRSVNAEKELEVQPLYP